MHVSAMAALLHCLCKSALFAVLLNTVYIDLFSLGQDQKLHAQHPRVPKCNEGELWCAGSGR